MEEYIFNCYLKYQKENNPSIMKRLMKFPVDVIILLLLGIVFITIGIVSFLLQKIVWSFMLIVSSVVIAYIFNWRFELYQIKNSEKIAAKHKDYCAELENWLSTFSISSTEGLAVLYERINNKITKSETAKKNAFDKIEKWAQILAIPIGVCIISELIKNEIDVSLIIGKCVTVVAIGAFIIYGFFIIETLKWMPIKRKTAQMQYFADDLRSILDYRLLSQEEVELQLSTADVT